MAKRTVYGPGMPQPAPETPATTAAGQSGRRKRAGAPGGFDWSRVFEVPVAMGRDDVGNYTDLEWLNPATNDKGQSIKMWLRVTPEMERAIHVVLAQRHFPYTTPDEIIRHAVYRHLFWLAHLEPDMPQHVLMAMDSLLEILRDETFKGEMQERIEPLIKRCIDLAQRGHTKEAKRILATVNAIATMVPDGPYRETLKLRVQDLTRKVFVAVEKYGEREAVPVAAPVN